MKKVLRILSFLLVVMSGSNAYGQITGIKINGDTCTQFTLALQAQGTSSSPYFFWNFGDPASGVNDTVTITGLSPSPFPTHTFSGPGIYNVCVSFQEPGAPVSTICRKISIGLCCNGIITSKDSCVQLSIPFSLVTGSTVTAINWNFGDPASSANNTSALSNPVHQFSAVGTYTVTANVSATCGNFTVTYPKTIVACHNAPLPCNAAISWRDSCRNNGSSFGVTSNSAISSVSWNFGDPASGSANTATGTTATHIFSGTGIFTVRAIVQLACGTDTVFLSRNIINCDTTSYPNCTLSLPDVFTPNNDGRNDLFGAITVCQPEQYECNVFNRWGELVFHTIDAGTRWDGRYKGHACDLGTYFYFVKYKFRLQEKQTKTGSVLLMR